MEAIPPRSHRLAQKRMLLTFDVDCGALVEGHRFIARGLEDDGVVEFYTGALPAFSFEYELVPGVPPRPSGKSVFAYLVGISYEADVALPFDPPDGGAIAPFEGGPSTHGSRGSWPLPLGTTALRFTLTGIDPATGYESKYPAGVLLVDLEDRTALWQPNESDKADAR